jgi:hypothetical protein
MGIKIICNFMLISKWGNLPVLLSPIKRYGKTQQFLGTYFLKSVFLAFYPQDINM